MDKSELKILLVNDHLGWKGEVLHGVARLFLTWTPLLEDAGHDVTVCILRKEDTLSHYFHDLGIDIRFLDRHQLDPRTLIDLIRLVRSEQFDVIHAQGYGGMNFGRLAGWMTGTPTVVHQHDTSEYYPWYQWLADGMLNWMSDLTLAVSEGVVDHCRANRNMWGVSEEKVRVLYNCVDTSKFQIPTPEEVQSARSELGIPETVPIVGTVTRLYLAKGNHYLVDAVPEILESYSEAMVVIVGEGPERENLQKRARDLGVEDHVILTGFRDDVSTMLSMFDVMMMTSYGTDGGSPLTVVEAMAMGRPIVTTDLVEIIEDGVTGLVVPPKSSEALAEAAVRLLGDRELSRRLAREAKARSEELDARRYVEKLSELYTEIIR